MCRALTLYYEYLQYSIIALRIDIANQLQRLLQLQLGSMNSFDR